MSKAEDESGLHNEKPEIEIRQITLDDLPKVFALGERLFTADRWPALYRTWDEYEVVTYFASDTETCFVAYLEDKLVGFVLGTTIEKRKSSWMYGYIVWLGVDPELEHCGIGSKLFQEEMEQFISMGARMILVDTDANNEPAIHFFKKLGFDHQNKHVYFSMNLTHRPEYQNYRKNHPNQD